MQYIIHLHQFEPQTYHDELFDLKERILLRSLQLRVRDYPGEDRYLFDAIKDLKDLKKKVILVFIETVARIPGYRIMPPSPCAESWWSEPGLGRAAPAAGPAPAGPRSPAAS